jgi:hypothetical protein
MSSPSKLKKKLPSKGNKKVPSAKKEKKERLELPTDCEKLATSACESPRTRDPKSGARKCRIKYGRLGFGNKCIKNQDYETEKFIFDQGFQEFASISAENMEKELRLRNKICENLDASAGGSCQSVLGEKLGCKINKKLLSPNTCNLDPKLIRFLKKRDLLCEKEDCAELRKKGIHCDKCTKELEEMLQEFDGLYDILVRKQNPPPADIARFFDLADQIKEEWYPYFVAGQKNLLNTLEKKRMKIEEIHGGARCQAYNISGCSCKGDNERQCSCRGFRDRIGMLCNIHRKCYLNRVAKFDEFRDKFDELCKKQICKPLLKNMKEFYGMIKYTTVGEVSIKKVEVDNIIEHTEEYLKFQ